MRTFRLLAAFGWVLTLVPAPVAAQQVGTAVVPAGITVGDVFHAVIRVQGGAAAPVTFPDSLVLPTDLEMAGRRRIEQDTVNGEPRWTALYPLTAWRPGTHDLAAAAVQLGGPAPQVATARFPAVTVRSVLPTDTAGIEPRPPHDVLGANRVWWPLLLAGALLLALLAALLWWWRRRRARTPLPEIVEPGIPPRAAALAALERARSSGALERGAYKPFYSDVSEALRGYVAALDARLGPDLTTGELNAQLRRTGRAAAARELSAVLEAADLVKFARHQPTPAVALEEWARARRFVETFDVPDPGALRAA